MTRSVVRTTHQISGVSAETVTIFSMMPRKYFVCSDTAHNNDRSQSTNEFRYNTGESGVVPMFQKKLQSSGSNRLNLIQDTVIQIPGEKIV